MQIALSHILLVGAGGCVGAVTRFLLGFAITRLLPSGNFPLATFLINVSGCLLIGWLSKLFPVGLESSGRLLLIVGFLGAYTTFSTFGNETMLLLQRGQIGMALGYVAASNLIGIVAVLIGQRLAA